MTWTEMLAVLVPLYLIVVQALRFRRLASIRQITKAQLERDPKLIDKVTRVLGYDLGVLMELGTAFGLFRTYGIPSGTKILDATGEFRNHCAKRYEDTDILLCEMHENPFRSERSNAAIKRMNEIHAHYNISMDDYLYTLTVFVCEPIRWTAKYDWRPMSHIEQEALVIKWREIGEKMGLVNIPQTVEEFFAFNVEYERMHMKYSKHNENVANATLGLFVSKAPEFLKPLLMLVIRSFLDERLCTAIGFQPAPKIVGQVVYALFRIRAFVMRHLMLPAFKLDYRTPKHADPTGRYFLNYTVYGNFYPNGYTMEEVGPAKWSKTL